MRILKKLIKQKLYILIILVIILFSLLYFCSYAFRKTVLVVFISYIIAYILTPLKRLIKTKKMKDSTIAILIIGGIILLISIIIILLVPFVVREINNFEEDVKNIIEVIRDKIDKLHIINESYIQLIFSQINLKVSQMTESVSTKGVDYLISIGEDAISFAIIPIVVYYFLADSKKISRKLYSFVPLNKRNIVKKICDDIDKMLGRYILSQIFLSGIVFACTFVILMIFKIRFFAILAIFNGILNIVPYFGPVLGAIPIVLISFIDSSRKGIWVTILIFIVQQVEGNILSPKITGDSIDMHPLLIIILLMIGENFGGFIGMIMAIPIGVIVKVIYEDINYYLF
ncbi:MAG: AI-2E family transporter [Clostridium sp.]|nr:AI-2E family transporter [Clostridium sp.]